MNADTKRHIDSARQVLVGVVPNPSTQIDQITNALIYKFMDDMDQSVIKIGGKPTFFTGDLEKYAWTRLMDTRLGSQAKMNLYDEALKKFSEAKQLPQLFRDIFKLAVLPYRSPEVLDLFLKEINYFDYSHSEELGNAFEYLLSVMGSQGDAGQFRTPRHIIEFIVDVVNPTKDDKILDPACGTAGFLISAYKHILEQHDGINDPEKKERPLTPEQKKNLTSNFTGYDISPEMVRLSKVNMYLHNFKDPKIVAYNTLADEERWNEKFDVILANPPFMSPKGAGKPHSKFTIQASKSEVLFVDYIMNHLRPKGRAGIIVPDGIVSNSASANNQLRKNLVNDGLFAVVSLPSGVFNPYAGVKTSILLFDNEIAKQKTEILFVKVENDGYDLGATKRPISKNDLPATLDILNKWKSSSVVPAEAGIQCVAVSKSKIAENGDYNLSGDRYRVATDYSNAKWSMVEFDDVISTIAPPAKIPKEYFKTEGSFPIIDQSQDEIAGWTNDETALVKSKKPLVIFGDHTCAVKYTEKSFAQGADGIKILLTNDQLVPKFFYYILKTKPVESEGYQRHFAKLKRYKIPLPPLEIQEQIVAELDGYAGIIAGAKQIAQNWKPKIDIDPEWEKVKLGEVCEVNPKKSEIKHLNDQTEVSFVPMSDLSQNGTYFDVLQTKKLSEVVGSYTYFAENDVLLARVTPCFENGKIGIAKNLKNKIGFGSSEYIVLRPTEKILPEIIYAFIATDEFSNNGKTKMTGTGGLQRVPVDFVKDWEIHLPPLEVQKQIVEKIEAERALVESAKKLIEIYDQKTKTSLAKLWTE